MKLAELARSAGGIGYTNICVPETELAERKKELEAGEARPRRLAPNSEGFREFRFRGWLARYQKLVSNASQGGVLG